MELNELVLSAAEEFPSDGGNVSIDLLTPDHRTHATVCTLAAAKEDTDYNKPGIYIGKDGVYDVILAVSELTPDIVRESLKALSKETGINYKLNL